MAAAIQAKASPVRIAPKPADSGAQFTAFLSDVAGTLLAAKNHGTREEPSSAAKAGDVQPPRILEMIDAQAPSAPSKLLDAADNARPATTTGRRSAPASGTSHISSARRTANQDSLREDIDTAADSRPAAGPALRAAPGGGESAERVEKTEMLFFSARQAVMAPPAPALSQQITAAITGLGASRAPSAKAEKAIEAPPPAIVKAPGSDILTVELAPANLGTIQVRMRLAGGFMDLRISSDRQETLHAIRSAKDELANVLHSAGCNPGDIAVDAHPRSHEAPPGAGTPESAADERAGGATGQRDGSRRPHTQLEPQSKAAEEIPAAGDSRALDRGAAQPRAGGLYL